MRPRTRRRLALVGGLALWLLVLILLWNTPVLYPLRLFVVLAHEVSHGVAAVLTGGRIERIVLTPDEGGLCLTRGGVPFVILSAGYLGSLGVGMGLLWAARRRGEMPTWVTAALGVGVWILSALYVRNAFGLLFAFLFGGALLLGQRLHRDVHVGALTALGLTSVLYAPLDIWSDVIDRSHLPSDAVLLAERTGIPSVVWGVLWIGVAVWMVVRVVRRAWAEA